MAKIKINMGIIVQIISIIWCSRRKRLINLLDSDWNMVNKINVEIKVKIIILL